MGPGQRPTGGWQEGKLGIRSRLHKWGENNHGRIIFKYLNNLPPDKSKQVRLHVLTAGQ